jgi:hypothetical protein
MGDSRAWSYIIVSSLKGCGMNHNLDARPTIHYLVDIKTHCLVRKCVRVTGVFYLPDSSRVSNEARNVTILKYIQLSSNRFLTIMQAKNMASIIENLNNCLQDFRTEISLISVMRIGEVRRYHDDIQRQLDECIAIRQRIISMNETYRKLTVIMGQTRVTLNEIQGRLDESLKEYKHDYLPWHSYSYVQLI